MRTIVKSKMDMCSGPILIKMLKFSLPLMLSSVLQLLFNATDIAVVGKFCGDASLAAVSSNGPLIDLLINVFIGIATGTNVLAARYFSAKKDKDLSDTVHTSMVIALVTGVAAMILGLICAPHVLTLMKTPDNVIPLASLYLRIYFLGMISTLVYNFGSALLRAIGDTNRPLYYLLIAGVLNVVLNLIFVIFLKLDVAGVALATIISQTLSAFLVVRCLMREEGAIRLIWRELRCVRSKLIQTIKIGLPAGIQGTLFSLANIAIQSSINIFGDITMSGNGAAASLETIGYMGTNAIYQAILSFTSQNYGQHKYKRILRVQLIGQSCIICTGLIFGLLITTFGPQLLWIYTDSADVVAAGLIRFSHIAPFLFLGGMMDAFVGGLRGIGYSFLPMISTLFGVCVIRLLWIATVFQIPAYHTIETVYVSYPLTWGITALINGIIYFIYFHKIVKKAKALEGYAE